MADNIPNGSPIESAVKFTVKEIVSDIWVDIKDIKKTLAVKADKEDFRVLESRVRLTEDRIAKLDTTLLEGKGHKLDFRWWAGAVLLVIFSCASVIFNVVNAMGG